MYFVTGTQIITSSLLYAMSFTFLIIIIIGGIIWFFSTNQVQFCFVFRFKGKKFQHMSILWQIAILGKMQMLYEWLFFSLSRLVGLTSHSLLHEWLVRADQSDGSNPIRLFRNIFPGCLTHNGTIFWSETAKGKSCEEDQGPFYPRRTRAPSIHFPLTEWNKDFKLC